MRIYQPPVITVIWHQWWCKLIRGRRVYYLPQNTVVLNEESNTHRTSSLHSAFIKSHLNVFISSVWFCSDASTHSSSTNRHLLQKPRGDYRGELIRLGSAIRRALDWQLKSCKVVTLLYICISEGPIARPVESSTLPVNSTLAMEITMWCLMFGGMLQGVHQASKWVAQYSLQ